MDSKKELFRLIFISCYIGKLPWYIDYFVHSCSFNPTIDFILFHNDTEPPTNAPKNLKFILTELDSLNKLASEKLDLPINIKSGYKLCDFKPTYGLLFENHIVGYDFWGYNDIDIIMGQIRSFITDDILKRYDIISVRHDFLTGYFQLFRNTRKMNNLFRKSMDHKKVFTSDRHFCFDETNFKFEDFRNGIHYSLIDSEIESMMHVVKKQEEKQLIRCFFDFLVVEGIPGNIIFDAGTLIYKQRFEILLYHLIHFKSVYKPDRRDPIPDLYNINTKEISWQ